MEKLKQFSVIYPRSQLLPSWLLDALDSALFYYQLVKSLLVVKLHIFPCWRNAVLTSHLDHCSPAGKETERSRDRETHGCLSLRKERRAPCAQCQMERSSPEKERDEERCCFLRVFADSINPSDRMFVVWER